MSNEKLSMNVGCDIIGNTELKNDPMPSNDTMKRKTCPKCKQILSFEMFNRRNRKTLMLNTYCKICQPIVYREWRVKNLETVKRRESLYRQNNKDKRRQWQKSYFQRWISRLDSRFACWKKGAHDRNIPFDLTLEQVKTMPLVCHYTGKKLVLESNKHNTVSLDRVDSSKGYTQKNVVYCCSFVNLMKRTLSYDEFIDTCKTIAEHHKR